MTYGDQKVKKSRSRGWTRADQARHDARQRREERERRQQAAARQRMLDGMTPGEREALAQAEDAERVKRADDQEKRQAEYKLKLKLHRENQVADSRLMAGYLQSEIATAIAWKESYGHHQGDWLDDPVAALTGQGGFGEEVAKSTGIKLQVHLALDCSNSMYHNQVHEISVEVMRTMYLALDQASKQLPPGSLTAHMWLWAQYADGRGVAQITRNDGRFDEGVDGEDPRGATAYLPGSASWDWTGEDTWIHPLFDALDDWETEYGDPGAYRLDIILSDGILEHPTDAREGDRIQDKRDGNLQSIVLNFLPMDEWGEYRVPNRCVQYPATAENLMGLLRGVLGEWLAGIL